MNKKNYRILSVKILKEGVEISYFDLKTDRNISIEDKKNAPHQDLVNTIQGFNEYLANVHLLPQEKYSQVSSTGFTIKADTIVVLKGMLTAPSEKKLAINSDAIDLSKDSYGFESDLRIVVDAVISETGKYLFEGKMIKQAKLDFEDTNLDKAEDVYDEAPGRTPKSNKQDEEGKSGNDLEKVDIPADIKDKDPDDESGISKREYVDKEPGPAGSDVDDPTV